MKATMVKAQRFLGLVLLGVAMMPVSAAHAAAPGVKGTSFQLTAQDSYISQPDGQAIYSWGYGCANTSGLTFVPAAISSGFCHTMQIPGPTLVVTEGDSVTVTLTNNLPAAAGNTSIIFSGINVQSTGGVPGLLTQEAAHGQTVTYTFTAPSPGTRSYYSGSQSDLQVEMGMYGAIIVLPKTIPANCAAGIHATNNQARAFWHEAEYRLAAAAFDHPASCYDREYLFQFSEIDPRIHIDAEAQVTAKNGCTAGAQGCSLNVATEPYHPAYFMINGRSMPDDMDPNYATEYPHQPYNGDPHMHPGELALIRVVGQGRWQHPFHEHANHVRILARDGNMILADPAETGATINYDGTTPGTALAGPALFTTSTVPGQTADGIFYFTGKGLNWDMYAHNPSSPDSVARLTCVPDANGYNTLGNSYTQINYFEWCQDHNKPLQTNPFGDVSGTGPVTLPDANILTNGAWYSGSPYLGPDATGRATGCMGSNDPQTNTPNCGTTATTPPSGTIANPPSSEAGFAYMWHSHNEREITTNNIFPGGMLMMLLVDSREFQIDETK